jgi:hypothetical protein
MLARLRARLTFANVCSFLALLIALGTGSAYAANTVFSTDIVDGEVKAADLDNNSVRSTKIGNGQVLNQDLGADAVDGSKVLDASIAHADLASGAVNSANVFDESLTSSDLATDSVNATEVANNSIDSGEIAADSVLASDLAGASVGASELQDAAVGGAELASNAVTGAKVAGNTLTTADIAGADVNGGGISVPTGYVPNGRCRQLDANVGGATAGEAVLFSIKSPLQDGVVIYGQRVPSAGHVMFDVCNFSGATQAQIDDIPVRVITFG